MSYSRASFRKWLESLPADEPFCDTECPIGEFLLEQNPLLDFASSVAVDKDGDLTEEIDRYCESSLGTTEGWSLLTPRQVLQVISELEAA